MPKGKMEVGAAEIDITPAVGVELCGFAARVQPSISVLDPLCAKALYLVDGEERLLWVHCDLLGLPRDFVEGFRQWALQELDLESRQVVLSATHTHSGPATIVLHEAGAIDPDYLGLLRERLEEVAAAAMEETQWGELVCVEGRCELAVDRRGKPSARTDPRVAAFGWRRADSGEFIATLVNYPMHAVALGPANRQISADWPGRCAARLTDTLPGDPVVLVTNGACGNLNPPTENVSVEQLDAWGGLVADSVGGLLVSAEPQTRPSLGVTAQVVPVPLEVLSADQIEAFAAASLENRAGLGEWGEKFRRAVETWRRDMLAAMESGSAAVSADVELCAIRLGPCGLVAVNAEAFCDFTDEIRAQADAPVYTIGYANGLAGYLPTEAAFAEGGYEVELAHLFYGGFRMRRGNLEHLAEMAAGLLR